MKIKTYISGLSILLILVWISHLNAQNGWERMADMPQATSWYGSCIDPVSEKAYIFGGSGPNESVLLWDTTQIYDFKTDSWSYGANMPAAASSFSAEMVNGKIYIIGEYLKPQVLPNVKEYDPVSNTWTEKGPLPEIFFAHGSCVYNGLIYLFGGRGEDPNPINTVRTYDPLTDTWDTLGDMPYERMKSAVCIYNDEIYLFGGDPSLKYTPSNDTWTELDAGECKIDGYAVPIIDGDRILLFGGYKFGDAYPNPSNEVWAYYPAIDLMVENDVGMPFDRFTRGHKYNNYVYLFGGHFNNTLGSVTNEVWRLKLDFLSLPNFTKVDTGAITQLWGGHISSACFDMDNDGDLDLLVSNVGVYASRDFSVYKNERNGSFVTIPRFVDLDDTRNLQSLGDIDNDGDMDLFAGIYGNFGSTRLYSNDGHGNFQFDKTFTLGNSSIYPSLIDLDGDGFLDMVLINNYGKVFYNDGDGGFPEYTNLGLLHGPPDIGMQGMSWGDCDDDGDMDFYGGYTYDGDVDHVSKNACFLNNGDGTFVKFDETSVIVDDSASANTCVNWVDYDNDGDMDLYVMNFTLDSIDGPLNALYENLGDMQFAKHVFEDEMYRNSFKVSSVWGDLDNDADLDLYVTVENNENPWGGGTSATPYNMLFLNDGNGGFMNFLDHTLAYEDAHTALMFDHDNDGDLDILLTRYSWSNDGYTNIYENEGNDNSWIVLTCEGTMSNRSAIGTRIYAKCFVNGKHITQTREITPINGHLTYSNLRVHFGLGDANIIDTLVIRWPSGHVDTYLEVDANQFYRAIEDEGLSIDFKAANYIQYSPAIPELTITEGDSTTINLNDYYHLITGDTVPEITGDTLTFSVFEIENPNAVTAAINGSSLTLTVGTAGESSKIKIIASAGFTERVDQFIVEVGYIGINDLTSDQNLIVYPNPACGTVDFQFGIVDFQRVTLRIYDLHGREVATVVDEVMPPGEHTVSIDVSGLPAGVYIIRKSAVSSQQSAVGKLIKL